MALNLCVWVLAMHRIFCWINIFQECQKFLSFDYFKPMYCFLILKIWSPFWFTLLWNFDNLHYFDIIKILKYLLKLCFLLWNNLIYLFYFWLYWVFAATCGLSLVVVSGGFSCCRSWSPEHEGFSSWGTQA